MQTFRNMRNFEWFLFLRAETTDQVAALVAVLPFFYSTSEVSVSLFIFFVRIVFLHLSRWSTVFHFFP